MDKKTKEELRPELEDLMAETKAALKQMQLHRSQVPIEITHEDQTHYLFGSYHRSARGRPHGLRDGKRRSQEGKEGKTNKLEAQAKITKAEAQKIALDRVPGGTIKEGDIEKEKGKLLWSFDIATPGTKDITEVQVDALTGQVLDVSKETAADQEKEKK